MKKQTAPKKLVLSPTTIRTLTAERLSRVVGGEPPDCDCTFGCRTSVPTKP